jgi:hypothetical protein
MKRILALSMLILFSCAVMPSHSFADITRKSPAKGAVAKAKVHSVDQIFMCTADVPVIFVNDAIPYAPAKDVTVTDPTRDVAATGHSPPVNRS